MKFYQYLDKNTCDKLIACESSDKKIYKLDLPNIKNTLDLFNDNGELKKIHQENLVLLSENYNEFLKEEEILVHYLEFLYHPFC